ncbi:MAG: hypothetical protein ACYCW6_21950 [Candidatus Xenobia bacterium]
MPRPLKLAPGVLVGLVVLGVLYWLWASARFAGLQKRYDLDVAQVCANFPRQYTVGRSRLEASFPYLRPPAIMVAFRT